MKKLIFILLLLLLFAVITMWAQYPTYGYSFNDTLFTVDQVAIDSIYFKSWRAPLGGSITFDFTTVSATDATITFGYSPDGVIFFPISNGSFILDNTDADLRGYKFEKTAAFDNVDTVYCKSFTKDNWSYKYIGWLLNKGRLDEDTIIIRYNK